MTPFKQTHHMQNPLNIELLNFVNQRGHATWLELFTAFGDGPADSKSATQRFSKKLEYLVYVEKLQASGKGKSRSFFIAPTAHQPTPGRGLTTAHATQVSGSDVLVHQAYCGQLVPPRQFNTMAAAPYVPPTHAAMRPGSLDYQRYASFGVRC